MMMRKNILAAKKIDLKEICLEIAKSIFANVTESKEWIIMVLLLDTEFKNRNWSCSLFHVILNWVFDELQYLVASNVRVKPSLMLGYQKKNLNVYLFTSAKG